jgi:hypothetical protein
VRKKRRRKKKKAGEGKRWNEKRKKERRAREKEKVRRRACFCCCCPYRIDGRDLWLFFFPVCIPRHLSAQRGRKKEREREREEGDDEKKRSFECFFFFVFSFHNFVSAAVHSTIRRKETRFPKMVRAARADQGPARGAEQGRKEE